MQREVMGWGRVDLARDSSTMFDALVASNVSPELRKPVLDRALRWSRPGTVVDMVTDFAEEVAVHQLASRSAEADVSTSQGRLSPRFVEQVITLRLSQSALPEIAVPDSLTATHLQQLIMGPPNVRFANSPLAPHALRAMGGLVDQQGVATLGGHGAGPVWHAHFEAGTESAFSAHHFARLMAHLPVDMAELNLDNLRYAPGVYGLPNGFRAPLAPSIVSGWSMIPDAIDLKYTGYRSKVVVPPYALPKVPR